MEESKKDKGRVTLLIVGAVSVSLWQVCPAALAILFVQLQGGAIGAPARILGHTYGAQSGLWASPSLS
jgi:hypothetical protein